jgi:phage terminase large subunit-like protein
LSPNLQAIALECTQRSALPAAPVKEAWLPVGRRGGKSRVIAFLATYTACFRDYHQHLAAGETAIIPIIAADMDQATIIYRYVLGFLEGIPMLRRLIVGEPKSQSVDLATGVTIRVRAASFRTVRGPAIPLAVLDEVAFWRTADAANPDHEIVKALKPGMLTIPGSMLIGLSSPYARRGVLWERYRAHYGQDGPCSSGRRRRSR